MGLLNAIVAKVWSLPQTLRGQPRLVQLDEPGERQIFAGRSPAGIWVTPDEALRLSTVWACVNVISKAIASSNWTVLEQDAEGNKEPRRDLPLWRLLNTAPNPYMTAFSFREAVLMQALLWGNSYSEIVRNGRGDPAELWPISPERGRLVYDDAGNLLLEVMNTGGNVYLEYRNVFHVRGPGLSGLEGMSPVAYAARTIGHAAAAEIFGATFYGNGTQMGGVLSTDQVLTEQQRADLLKSINDRHAGPENANKFMLLQGGLKYTQLSPTQEQSQFLETREFLVTEICRFYGVPPHKIAHYNRTTNSSVQEQGLEFRDTLIPWAERLCQEADKKLLPFGNRMLMTRMDIAWTSEGDMAARAEADAKHVGAGIRTRNEVRADHGWNMHPDGGELTSQMQYKSTKQIEELADAEIKKTLAEAERAAAPPQAPAAPSANDGGTSTQDDRAT